VSIIDDYGQKSKHYQIGLFHIDIYNRWQGLKYSNYKHSLGWEIKLGFIIFWGYKEENWKDL
jgi:hypothetical protein